MLNYYNAPTLHRVNRGSSIDSSLDTGRIRLRRVRFQNPSSVSFFGPHRAPGRELSEFLSAYHCCAKDLVTSPSFFVAELTEFAVECSARFLQAVLNQIPYNPVLGGRLGY